MAKSREDYVHLRLHADWNEWQKRIKEKSETNSMETLGQSSVYDNWKKWSQLVRQSGFNEFHSDVNYQTGSESGRPFGGANYLFSDIQFNHIRKLATDGKISIAHFDFGNEQAMKKLFTVMAENNLKISVLDISNAYEEGYLGYQGLSSLLMNAEHVTHSESVLLLTRAIVNFERALRFVYIGHTFGWMKRYVRLSQGYALPWYDSLKRFDVILDGGNIPRYGSHFLGLEKVITPDEVSGEVSQPCDFFLKLLSAIKKINSTAELRR
jgi:hypothetical protein